MRRATRVMSCSFSSHRVSYSKMTRQINAVRRCRTEEDMSLREARETIMPSTPQHCIAVRSATEQYDIHIGSGVLANVGQQVVALTPGRKAFVVSHPQLCKLYGTALVDSLRAAGLSAEACLVPEGERRKSLLTASRL